MREEEKRRAAETGAIAGTPECGAAGIHLQRRLR